MNNKKFQSLDKLGIILSGNHTEALNLVPRAKLFVLSIMTELETRSISIVTRSLNFPDGSSIFATISPSTQVVTIFAPFAEESTTTEAKEEIASGWILISEAKNPVGGCGGFLGRTTLVVPVYRNGIKTFGLSSSNAYRTDAMSIRHRHVGNLCENVWDQGSYIFPWVIESSHHDNNFEELYIQIHYIEEDIILQYKSWTDIAVAPLKIFSTSNVSMVTDVGRRVVIETTQPDDIYVSFLEYTDYVKKEASVFVNPQAVTMQYISQMDVDCPVSAGTFLTSRDGSFLYRAPGGDFQDDTVTAFSTTGTLSFTNLEISEHYKYITAPADFTWIINHEGSEPGGDFETEITATDYRRSGCVIPHSMIPSFTAGIDQDTVPMIPDLGRIPLYFVWRSTIVTSLYSIAAIFSAYTENGTTLDTNGGTLYQNIVKLGINVKQYEEDGTLVNAELLLYDKNLGIPSTGDSVKILIFKYDLGFFYYTLLARAFEIQLAPRNLMLLTEDREYTTQYIAPSDDSGDEDEYQEEPDEKRGILVRYAWHLNELKTWDALAIDTGTLAHVVRWAENGSGYVTRLWSKETYGYLYTSSAIYNQVDISTYAVVSVYTDENSVKRIGSKLVIKSTLYPSIYNPVSSVRFSLFFSKNLRIVAVRGSLDTDGIWVRGEYGNYTKLPNSELHGMEPVHISDDERMIATATQIWIDEVLVATPTWCCGVFFDKTHYVDRVLSDKFVIKDMAGVIKDETPQGLYNFWEISDDSTLATFSKYRVIENGITPSASCGVMLVVDFADRCYKFESTQEQLLYDFYDYMLPSEAGKFYGYYYVENLEGVPFGRRYNFQYTHDGSDFFVYVEPSWGMNGYTTTTSYSDVTYIAMVFKGSDGIYVEGPRIHVRPDITGANLAVSVCYLDGDKKRSNSEYTYKRIIKHFFHHKFGIFERIDPRVDSDSGFISYTVNS